jgi:N-methylhydantoinase B/oxoprolinase/acetone carboxylase alpha subunit
MSKEHLSEYFDAVVKKDDDAAQEAFSQYIEKKGKSILRELMDEVKKPIRLKGNDVLVKGKKVGTINNKLEGDKEGEEPKVEYTCADTQVGRI